MEGRGWLGLTDDGETFWQSVDLVRTGDNYLTYFSEIVKLEM